MKKTRYIRSQQLHKSALWINSHYYSETRYAASHHCDSIIHSNFCDSSFSLRDFYLNLLTWALCIKIITVELQKQLTSGLCDPGGGYVRTQETMEYIMTVNERVQCRKCSGHLCLCRLIGKSHTVITTLAC